MGAFIGTGNIGIWASNGERNDFLDWFADNRCSPGDARWQWCKDAAQRWSGRCIDLSEFLRPGGAFHVSEAELLAAQQYGDCLPKLLMHLQEISRGEWHYTVTSSEAVRWRPAPQEAPAT